jgi:hypothetical protein
MVTTKNLLIIFAVLLLLLTLLSAFGGSIHPVENFDYTRNPVTGGKSSEYFTLQEGAMQGPMGPMQGPMEEPMGPMQGPMTAMTSMENMNYPAKPMSLPSMAGLSEVDGLYDSSNYGSVEHFANSTKINTGTLSNGLKLANTGVTSIINNAKLSPEKKTIANEINTDIMDATKKTESLQKFTQYPTATIEHFVEPFENDNGLKALYAAV